MRVIGLILVLTAASATGQVRVDGTGVSAPGMRVDASGVHTGEADEISLGVGQSGGTTINTNGNTRTVDCGGGALTVNGNSNRLTVAHCSRVTIAGNGNVAVVAFSHTGSRLFVPGNRNTVTWNAPRDVRVSASAPGTRNSVKRS